MKDLQYLKNRVEKFQKNGKNTFSSTEAIMIGFCYPDLFKKIVPENWKEKPLQAYFKFLNENQREIIKQHWRLN